MAEQLNWSYLVTVDGGPQVKASGTTCVDAYDKLTVAIPDGEDQQVDLVPSGSEPVKLLVINPFTPDAKLTYKVGSSDVTLDAPHVFLGTGVVGLLAGATSLTFTNGTGDEAKIEILVGRDATPTT